MLEGIKSTRGAASQSPVPEALGRLLALLARRVDPGSVDRIWIFPPLVKGRKEWGLVAVSCMEESETLRSLVTGKYVAEMTGKGMMFEPEFISEGSAPQERFPSVMDGVVRRSDLQLGVPLEVGIGGDADKFWALLKEHGWKGPPEGPVAS